MNPLTQDALNGIIFESTHTYMRQYRHDFLANTINKECSFSNSAHPQHHLAMNISSNVRCIIFAWMSRIFSVFCLGYETRHLAFTIFDNGLQKLNLIQEQYTCLAW